jgi:hypothetical protein
LILDYIAGAVEELDTALFLFYVIHTETPKYCPLAFVGW